MWPAPVHLGIYIAELLGKCSPWPHPHLWEWCLAASIYIAYEIGLLDFLLAFSCAGLSPLRVLQVSLLDIVAKSHQKEAMPFHLQHWTVFMFEFQWAPGRLPLPVISFGLVLVCRMLLLDMFPGCCCWLQFPEHCLLVLGFQDMNVVAVVGPGCCLQGFPRCCLLVLVSRTLLLALFSIRFMQWIWSLCMLLRLWRF